MVDIAAMVGLFCSAEEPTDKGNPDRNCDCTDSDKG